MAIISTGRQLLVDRCRPPRGHPTQTSYSHRQRAGWAAVDSADRGSASAETAVVLPALLVLILLVVQTALYAHARNLTQSAAQEGLRAARLRAARLRAGSAAAGQSAARSFLAATAGTLLTSPTVSAARSPTTATVTVDGHAAAVVPFLDLAVHSTAAGPVERFVPAAG